MIEHCGLVFRVPAPTGLDDRLVFLGDDADGVALEVMGVQLEGGGILVIHAMPLRSRYVTQYQEAQAWRV